jgi:hypothetical protein
MIRQTLDSSHSNDEGKYEMTKVNISKDLFKTVIKRRGENTEALEKREKGDFKVKRFMPLNERKKAPQTTGGPADTTDDHSNGTESTT